MCLHFQVWQKFAITSTSEGKAIEDLDLDVAIGDKGISLSDLRPMGKAELNNKNYEVQTTGEVSYLMLSKEILNNKKQVKTYVQISEHMLVNIKNNVDDK